jgi:hypothetical protein
MIDFSITISIPNDFPLLFAHEFVKNCPDGMSVGYNTGHPVSFLLYRIYPKDVVDAPIAYQ